jgi:hypothetical protein
MMDWQLYWTSEISVIKNTPLPLEESAGLQIHTDFSSAYVNSSMNLVYSFGRMYVSGVKAYILPNSPL